MPGPHRVGGRQSGARLHGTLDAQQDSYLYLVGLDFVTDPGTAGGGDVLQIASDDHVLIRDCKLDGSDGTTQLAQETLKANQCQYVYVEGSDISGAFWFPLDFVAVQYGHILGCKIHDAGDDGLVLKGGTAEILVQGNEVYDVPPPSASPPAREPAWTSWSRRGTSTRRMTCRSSAITSTTCRTPGWPSWAGRISSRRATCCTTSGSTRTWDRRCS